MPLLKFHIPNVAAGEVNYPKVEDAQAARDRMFERGYKVMLVGVDKTFRSKARDERDAAHERHRERMAALEARSW